MRKRMILILVAGIILVATPFTLSWINHRNSGRINILVAPEDSLIKIDSKKAKRGLNYLKPGYHEIKAEKKDFDTDKKTVFIKQNDESIQDIFLLPKAVSQAAQDWLKANPKAQQQREALGGQDFFSKTEQTNKKYPLTGRLPYIDRYFRVDAGSGVRSKDQATPTAIYIRASSPQNRQLALSWMRQQGFDPTDYEIIFKNFTNPFGGQL